MKLTHAMKKMLDALAHAHAGENLNLRQKMAALGGLTGSEKGSPKSGLGAGRPQIGLYAGRDLPAEVMHYVVQTCVRMGHGLTVFTPLSEAEAESLLLPYEALLKSSGIVPTVVVLRGEPPANLAQALRRHREVAFVVCQASGWLGRGLTQGTIRRDALPVPVVLVSGDAAELAAAEKEVTRITGRAA